MSAHRYSQRALIDEINSRIAADGLALCALADAGGVADVGAYFVMDRHTRQVVTPHADVATIAHRLRLIRFPAEIGV